jgi:hypothetical protein
VWHRSDGGNELARFKGLRDVHLESCLPDQVAPIRVRQGDAAHRRVGPVHGKPLQRSEP